MLSATDVLKKVKQEMGGLNDRTRVLPIAGDIVIAVMGVTGVGKSTFVNHFSNESAIVGHGLEACTANVEIYPSTLPDGTKLFLVDTPGFDDTYKSDTVILREIASWLSTAHEEKIKLAGIVYLHRILDVRVGGAAMQNLRMFKALCGNDSLEAVVLATTRWHNVTLDEGIEREQQLCDSPNMWKQMIDHGSKVMRQDRDEASAREILEYLIKRKKPVTLDIQVELVDNKKNLNETGAGQELHAELEKQKKHYEKQLATLRKEMGDAMVKMDKDMKKEFQVEKDEIKRRLREAREHDRQLQIGREELRRQMALEAQKERNTLLEQLRQQERLLAREENRLEQQKERHKYQLQTNKMTTYLQQQEKENAKLRRRINNARLDCVIM
ncbi:uncharacterized protein EKO05_0011164 [Ascochyta rabiei]|uniref:GTP binding n=1 Tax=Didymella rabiei TaxID=5454 RepID=A0A163A9F8_DIDRA|nr:uncharacterized protein EKO05_0011164 [Ascochyta rabiei]KZM21060.1 GTP binding [Ascochyta rabiei]UPX20957.1 hypothetical protein EKO05_0011164 [Ascochyta rabiei]